MIRSLVAHDIEAVRRDGLTGIWVGTRETGLRKIGSIGVGIKRWTTCHGFALNVCPDLSYFSGIVPCGIDGCEMTSIEVLSDKEIGVDEFATTIRSRFMEVFGYEESVTVDSARLWQLVASNATALEEQHRNA